MKFAKPGVTNPAGQAKLSPTQRWLTDSFATGLGTGFLPFAQGTFASALLVLLWKYFVPEDRKVEMTVAVLLNVLSVPLSNWGEKSWGHDPGRVTIDEFAGQAVALVGVGRSPFQLVMAFLFFRLFDIFKLPFIRKHLETLPSGWGITLDDTAAGLLARICMIPLQYVQRVK